MDVTTLGAAIAIAKNIPGSAAQRAEAAAQAAEESAEAAAAHNYAITITDGVLNITESEE